MYIFTNTRTFIRSSCIHITFQHSLLNDKTKNPNKKPKYKWNRNKHKKHTDSHSNLETVTCDFCHSPITLKMFYCHRNRCEHVYLNGGYHADFNWHMTKHKVQRFSFCQVHSHLPKIHTQAPKSILAPKRLMVANTMASSNTGKFKVFTLLYWNIIIIHTNKLHWSSTFIGNYAHP